MGSVLVCSPANKPLGVFSGPHRAQQNVDLQQISRHFSSKDGFIQDHQRIGIWGLQTVNLVQVLPSPPPMAREEHFYRGGKESWEGNSKHSPWFFIEWIPARKEKSSFFILSFALITWHGSSPFWPLKSICLRFLFIIIIFFSFFYKIFTLLECQIRRVFFCSLEILYLILHIFSVEEQK